MHKHKKIGTYEEIGLGNRRLGIFTELSALMGPVDDMLHHHVLDNRQVRGRAEIGKRDLTLSELKKKGLVWASFEFSFLKAKCELNAQPFLSSSVCICM